MIFHWTINKILGCVNSSPRPEESRNLKLYVFTLIEGEQGLKGGVTGAGVETRFRAAQLFSI